MIGIGFQKRPAGHYRVAFSGDTALELPEDKEARARALRIARETGNWAAITKSGEMPWLFVLQPLSTEQLTAWSSQRDEHGNVVAETEQGALQLLRVALVDVENVPDAPTVRRIADDRFGTIAAPDILDIIPRSHLQAVAAELSLYIQLRERDLLPK